MGVFNEKWCKLCLQLLSFLNYLGETKKGGCKFPPSQTNSERKNAEDVSIWMKHIFHFTRKETTTSSKMSSGVKKGKILSFGQERFYCYLVTYICLLIQFTMTGKQQQLQLTENQVRCLHKTCISNESLTHIVVG